MGLPGHMLTTAKIMASPAFPFVNPKTIASFFLLFAILTWTLLYGQGMLHTEVLSIERESTPTRPAPVTFEDVAANSPPADPYSSIIDAQNATLGVGCAAPVVMMRY
jgi:hypothetical protein